MATTWWYGRMGEIVTLVVALVGDRLDVEDHQVGMLQIPSPWHPLLTPKA